MKKIVCLVDFSDVANDALEYAGNMAKQTSSSLVLLHVLPFPSPGDAMLAGSGFEVSAEAKKKEAEEKLEVYANVVRERFQVSCETAVSCDIQTIEKGICKELEKIDADLVVMGTNGAENLNQFFFGSHSRRLIKNIDVPLLIIPQGYEFQKPERIVYATDYENGDVPLVKKLLEFMVGFNPEITIVHISTKPSSENKLIYEALKDLLEDELDRPQIHFEHIVDVDPVEGINGYMQKSHSDMLVMLSKSGEFPKKIFHQNVILKVNERATYPLFIFPVFKEQKSEKIWPIDVAF